MESVPDAQASSDVAVENHLDGMSREVDGSSYEQRPWRRRVQAVVFWLTIPGLLVVVATLMVGHWYTLPKPETGDPHVRAAMAELRAEGEDGKWMAVHVLYSDCGCSRRVLDHLFSSERPEGMTEKVVLVGAHEEFEERTKAAGFGLEVLKLKELKTRFNLESAPLMVVAAPTGELKYMGGYTERKRGIAIRDLEIIQRLRTDQATIELPLFGCAVSKELQDILDPLGFKYSSAESE